jgi:hypothetical protein
MAEPRPTPTGNELERRLRHLATQLDYPPTPDLTSTVGGRIGAAPSRWWRRRPSLPRLGLALGSVAVLGVAILLAVPAGRDAVAERLGLKGVSITYEARPTAQPSAADPTVVPGTLGEGLGLGEAVALGDAPGRVSFQILFPSIDQLGLPDAEYVGASPPGGRVSLVYRARDGLPLTAETGVGLVLTQFRGEFVPYIQKVIGQGTRIERVTVNGRLGLWIEGQPHTVIFRDSTGQVHEDRSRLAANTLLWEQDGLTLRLESSLSRDEALRIAELVGPLGKK